MSLVPISKREVLVGKLVNISVNYRVMVGLDRDFLNEIFTDLVKEYDEA